MAEANLLPDDNDLPFINIGRTISPTNDSSDIDLEDKSIKTTIKAAGALIKVPKTIADSIKITVLVEEKEDNNTLPDGLSCEQRIFTGLYTVNVEYANQTVHGKEENPHQPSEETIDDFVTFQIPLSEENRTCAKYYKFACLCRKQSKWYSVAAYYNEDGFVEFKSKGFRFQSFCIIGQPRGDSFVIPSTGVRFTSRLDQRVKINFPNGCVTKDTLVDIKVFPLQKDILPKLDKYFLGEINFVSVSDCIDVEHAKGCFTGTPIEICLPLHDLPLSEGDDIDQGDTEYVLFEAPAKSSDLKQTTPKQLTMLDDNIVSFVVTGFYRKILVKKRKEKRNEEIVSNNLRTASGDMAICRVLCYVNTGNKRNGSIEVSLEIVRSFEADDVADDRLKNGLRLLLECPCSDIKLQNNSKIRVKLSGIFTLKKGIDKNYLVMHYNSASKVNIRMFPLIKVQKIDGNPDGIIEIFHHVKNQLFHIITLDPWGRKMLLLQKQESTIYKRLHERNEDKESPTKENSAQVGKSQQDEYFDRINIAAIADVLDEDQIYSISTQIGLPHDQYENMTKEIGYLTPLFKKAKYLSTALQMHDESKVQLTKLREALFAIDRENLALKIEALYWRSEKLSKKVLKGHIY